MSSGKRTPAPITTATGKKRGKSPTQLP